MKLLNIKINEEKYDYKPTLFNIISCFYCEKFETVEENFIEAFINILTDNNIDISVLKDERWKNLVKYQAQQTEWEY